MNNNSRSIKCANNWKKKKLKTIEILQNEMINLKIDKKLIDEYINEQYDIINQEYKNKIEKPKNIYNSENLKQRKKDIFNLIKNKLILEKTNINTNLINEYTNTQYLLINKKFNTVIDNNVSDDGNEIEFLD